MAELNDYSGPFRPDLKLSDFSKEFLLRLIPHWQWTWFQMDAAWFDGILDRYGPDFAWYVNGKVYAQEVPERCNRRYAKMFNIKRDNVVDSLKVLQLPLDNTMGGQYPTTYDIRDENHAVLSVWGCPNLEWYEHQAPERIRPMCQINEIQMIRGYVCNPNIEVKALRLPPRQSPEEMACQWEHSIDVPEGVRVRSTDEVVDETTEIPELDDYSGPFYPNLRHKNLSKSFLLKLLDSWQFVLLIMNQAYFDWTSDRHGRAAAVEINREAWSRVTQRCNRRYLRMAGIELNTLLDSLKCLQLPMANSMGRLYPAEYDIKNENHVVMTIRDCRSLGYWERRGHVPEMTEAVCHASEREAIQRYLLNPNIEVTPLQLPPRRSRDDAACRWEFKLRG